MGDSEAAANTRRWLPRDVVPRDVVREIAVWLPTKSLLRFKAVSKWWRSLISDSSFLDQHLASTATQPNNPEHRRLAIFIQPWDVVEDFRQLVTFVINHNDVSFPVDSTIQHRLKIRERTRRIEVSDDDYFIYFSYCRGIFMVGTRRKDEFFLWNPSTMEKKRIPQSPMAKENGRSIISYYNQSEYRLDAAGLGYDLSTNTLKVVMVGTKSNRRIVEVYDVKTNSWTNCSPIDDDDDESSNFRPCYYCATLADGSVCWKDLRDNYNRIVCYNVGANKFTEVPLPPPMEGTLGWDYKGLDIDGSLGVQIENEIWVMKEFGVKESWTKLNMDHIPNGEEPVCVAKNGEVSVSMDDRGVERGLGTNILVRHRMEIKPKIKFPDGRWRHVESISYVPTLLPLYAEQDTNTTDDDFHMIRIIRSFNDHDKRRRSDHDKRRRGRKGRHVTS